MQVLRFKIKNKKSSIEGTGAFAGEIIKFRQKIGDLGGEIISQREGRKRVAVMERIAMVEFGNGKSLDASINSNALRFINHSCSPNTYMRVCFPRVEFYALRDIKRGEEITCNYGTTHHDGKLPCRCGSSKCNSFL